MQELRPVEVRIAYAMVIEGSLLKISSVDPAVLVFGDFFEKGVEDTTVEEISCDEFRCYCKMHTMGWEDMILFINPQISLTRMFSKLETLFGEKRIETCSIVLGRMGEDDTLVNARVLVKIGNLSDWKTYWTSLKKRSDLDVEDHGIYGGHDRELVFKQVSLKILMEVLRDTRKHALDTHTYIVGDTPPP
ncbi:MAG: hypothetical protein KAT70_02145 [Thermoplasmata archaeon]|nr:hypothetical protein [Thermoplasmata archaeon]